MAEAQVKTSPEEKEVFEINRQNMQALQGYLILTAELFVVLIIMMAFNFAGIDNGQYISAFPGGDDGPYKAQKQLEVDAEDAQNKGLKGPALLLFFVGGAVLAARIIFPLQFRPIGPIPVCIVSTGLSGIGWGMMPVWVWQCHWMVIGTLFVMSAFSTAAIAMFVALGMSIGRMGALGAANVLGCLIGNGLSWSVFKSKLGPNDNKNGQMMLSTVVTLAATAFMVLMTVTPILNNKSINWLIPMPVAGVFIFPIARYHPLDVMALGPPLSTTEEDIMKILGQASDWALDGGVLTENDRSKINAIGGAKEQPAIPAAMV